MGVMSKFPVEVTFFDKVQNKRWVYVLKQCLQVWHSVILLTNRRGSRGGAHLAHVPHFSMTNDFGGKYASQMLENGI